MAIKAGNFEYEDLVKWADELSKNIMQDFANSHLPDVPNEQRVMEHLIVVREMLYAR